jgi:hypothetical protein
MDAARGDVDLDLVAGLHEGKRTADKALRRHMQNAGAVAGAAHARVGNAHHVAHPGFHELLRNRQHAPFRHARAAFRSGVFEHQHMVGRHVEIVALHFARHVLVILEGKRFAAMLEEALIGGRRLHHAAVRCEVCQ